MKIEVGESLFYSWLRHVKECQIVQTNWKVSQQWELMYEEELADIYDAIDTYFKQEYGYNVFKKNAHVQQLLKQGECDVLGISLKNGKFKTYAVEVAFHEAGLNYGSKEETVMKVVEKCARAAFCLYGYLGTRNTEIIFASPKINPAVIEALEPCIEALNTIFSDRGYGFRARIIANSDYEKLVLKPILLTSDGVSDTSELFLRSYQMFKMFDGEKQMKSQKRDTNEVTTRAAAEKPSDLLDDNEFSELKVGQIARTVLAKLLVNGAASEREIELMQTKEYSKDVFDLQYPLLIEVKKGEPRPVRYYQPILQIYGKKYRMCSEWFETASNDDRTPLIRWINARKG